MLISPWAPTYVIKEWKVSNQPLAGQPYVHIKGRSPGLISWLLALVGIEPTVSFQVTQDSIIYQQGSLSGSIQRTIPLSQISSTIHGYNKPIALIALAIVFGLQGIVAAAATRAPGMALVGLVVAAVFFVFYFLNKSITVGVIEVAGVANVIRFKRSVIEGQNIDENAAANVVGIVDYLTRLNNQQQLPR